MLSVPGATDASGKEAVPRGEYPRPQFRRDRWQCLNGWWQFETDPGDSGLERGLCSRELRHRILVPFCPEAPLSSVALDDRVAAVWYRREVTVPPAWAGERIVLHFQAVDYEATVWVNETLVGRHNGGFTPFSCDCSAAVAAGERACIVVRARDPWWSSQPRGKQARELRPRDALYRRTTGIWQTVWMEPVSTPTLRRPRITPDLGMGGLWLEQPIANAGRGATLVARLLDGDELLTVREHSCQGELAVTVELPIPAKRRRLWTLSDPHLYDLQIEIVDSSGVTIDKASSYAGLRSITIAGRALLLNGEPLFQRLVLDQGFYPDGIMTAPDDEALIADIELAKQAGFNGARLHQKVFEERFLYHADRLGYLLWGEFADWGCSGFGPSHDHQQPGGAYITQWLEVLERDYSHPSIVGWCPLNETYQPLSDRLLALDDVTRGMYLATKAIDPFRPVIDASGYSHRVVDADVYDSHDYEQDPETLRANHARLAKGTAHVNRWRDREISVPYAGQPYLVSEFGGTWWEHDPAADADVWGYGERPRSVEEFFARFRDLCSVLLDNEAVAGYCYTQLTDVEQERNGILDFQRRPKLPLERFREVQARPAAIERQGRPAER